MRDLSDIDKDASSVRLDDDYSTLNSGDIDEGDTSLEEDVIIEELTEESSGNDEDGGSTANTTYVDEDGAPIRYREVRVFKAAFARQATDHLPEGKEEERMPPRSWCCGNRPRKNIKPCSKDGIVSYANNDVTLMLASWMAYRRSMFDILVYFVIFFL